VYTVVRIIIGLDQVPMFNNQIHCIFEIVIKNMLFYYLIIHTCGKHTL